VTVFHFFFRGLPLNAITFILDFLYPSELSVAALLGDRRWPALKKSSCYFSFKPVATIQHA
jgi:hypothetical protein